MNKDFLDTKYGKTYYFYKPSNKNEKTLIFIPGFSGDSAYNSFRNIIDKLPDSIGILVVDTVGTGHSYKEYMNRTPGNVVGNIIEVITYLKPINPMFVGHSYGGAYALQLVDKVSDLTNELFLIEPTYSQITFKLLDKTYQFLKQYKDFSEEKAKGSINAEDFIDSVNPLVTEEIIKENAELLFNVYANESIIAECLATEEMVKQMEIAERNLDNFHIVLLCSKEREEEYKNSIFAPSCKILSAAGNHSLHWTNEKFVLDNLINFINGSE
ncbi:hypothetical protein BG262_03665 [Floricoccus penangensis]|uniref:AB hydrolase-1 domain-containing protein n=1 Tax=Floricoccus penangensis TaxID=1859475 RepID=A0A9Q5NZT8_9LACT|nr:alpha/beta hydrolase [Floricoccus penangensis]OFI46898.1 hypothetical protein BG262_03665 [Floricoccus penangensis]